MTLLLLISASHTNDFATDGADTEQLQVRQALLRQNSKISITAHERKYNASGTQAAPFDQSGLLSDGLE